MEHEEMIVKMCQIDTQRDTIPTKFANDMIRKAVKMSFVYWEKKVT